MFNLRQPRVSPMASAFVLTLFVCACSQLTVRGDSTSNRILCRPELASSRRQELAKRLQEITGWQSLDFDEHGVLIYGQSRAKGGSVIARTLLTKASAQDSLLVLEDASDRSDVVFSRVVEGRWTSTVGPNPAAYIIQIDFTDFSRVTGHRDALAAFNAGWGVLHELAHVVYKARDARSGGESGECEDLINAMRRECGLAERAEYHFHLLPGVGHSQFKTKFVRLAFDRYEPGSTRKQRLWLFWDADLVGGLGRQKP